jgi:hypothetical protein
MNAKTTRWLLLLALAAFAFILLFERRTADTDQQAERAARLFPDWVGSEVTGLDVTRGADLFVRVERTNEQWRLRLPVAYPAAPAGIERLIGALVELRQRGFLTAQEVVAQTNWAAAFGLEPPAAIVVAHRPNQRLELRLGRHTVLGGQAYLQVIGRTGLFLIDADFLKALPNSVNEWRDTALVNLSRLEFDRCEVRPGTNGFEVLRDPAQRYWQMTKPLLTRANTGRLEFLLQQLQLARVSQFVTDDPRADLDPFGLQPPERELVIGRGTNDLVTLQIGKSPTNAPNLVYLRHLGQSNVVLAPRAAVEPWLAGFREFCDRRLMIFKPEAVERIEARSDEAFALERQTNDSWRIVAPYSAPADRVLVLDMLANLFDLEFLEFEREVVTDFTAYGLNPPRRQYLLKAALTNAPAGPTNPTLAQVDFGNPTGHKLFARRSLENSVVTAVDNGRLPRAAFELRERRLWNFTTNQIASITVQQRGQTRRLLRTGPAQWTLGPGASGTINPFSLEEAAYRLGRLRAAVWVACGEAELTRLGIPAADHQITVELAPAEKAKPLSLRFGRTSPSGRPYAAVQLEGEPGPLIFECPLDIYELVLANLSLMPPPAEPPAKP